MSSSCRVLKAKLIRHVLKKGLLLIKLDQKNTFQKSSFLIRRFIVIR